MQKLHLHIGSYKTGTTAIQQALYQNKSILSQQGFSYPGSREKHHQLFFITKAPKEDWPREFRSYNQQILRSRIQDFLGEFEKGVSSDKSNVIISTEYFFISNKKQVKNASNYLRVFFDKLFVYIFVRSPIAYYRSYQQQMIKGRSYITCPYSFYYNFKEVINSWRKFAEVTVLSYGTNTDSAKKLATNIGLDLKGALMNSKGINQSISVEKMLLIEKIQQKFYIQQDDVLKPHLYPLIKHINAPFTSKQKLQEWVKPIIYQNHLEDLQWLKEEYGIDFLNEELEKQEIASAPNFENGKASVRDIYKLSSKESVEKYEALIVDSLLKKLVQNRQN